MFRQADVGTETPEKPVVRRSHCRTKDMRGHFDRFFRITARWHLSQAERRALLGSPSDERWFQFIRDVVPGATPEEFARVLAVIRIDEALSHWIGDPREAARWIRTLEVASPFFGRTPLAVLFRGGDGFTTVAEYLEARRPVIRESALR
jgi:hypothetical protein